MSSGGIPDTVWTVRRRHLLVAAWASGSGGHADGVRWRRKAGSGTEPGLLGQRDLRHSRLFVGRENEGASGVDGLGKAFAKRSIYVLCDFRPAGGGAAGHRSVGKGNAPLVHQLSRQWHSWAAKCGSDKR